MMEIFETFRPANALIKKYVEYYYLDIKPQNQLNEFVCFPHFNNTISLYKSHIRNRIGEMIFAEEARPFQIFTPIRETVLHVKQTGKVYRIVIVFRPLGVHQFFRNVSFSDYVFTAEFFNQEELQRLFSTVDTTVLGNLLDTFLEKKFILFENVLLNKSVQFIFENEEQFSVNEMAERIGVSRQHLNRLFRSCFGVSVKKFHEIVVFRKTVNNKLFENPEESFTKLAYEFNYNDQSHLNKIYKTFTANSPSSFYKKGTILGEEDTFWHIQP